MMSKKQREAMTLAALGRSSRCSSGRRPPPPRPTPTATPTPTPTAAGWRCRSSVRAEPNGGGERGLRLHDPLAHGADSSRALAKIEQRKREQMSMKGESLELD